MVPEPLALFLDRFCAKIPALELGAGSSSLDDRGIDWTDVLIGCDWCEDNGFESVGRMFRYFHSNSSSLWTLFTGSRCYGTPHEDSDWDVVVWADKEEMAEVAGLADDTKGPYQVGAYEQCFGIEVTFRFGPVNVIGVVRTRQWNAWRNGTLRLIQEKPVTRPRAVEEFQRQFQWYNMRLRPSGSRTPSPYHEE